MQAMKVEKDNAMDRSDVCEQAAKDAKVTFLPFYASQRMLRLFLAPAGALNVMLHHYLPFSHSNAMDRAFFHLGVPYFSFW